MPTTNGLTTAQQNAAFDFILAPELDCSNEKQEHNLRVAQYLAHCGIAVFPVDGNKRPFPGFKWKDKATTDPATVCRWWEKYPNAVPAVPTGSENGFDVLDVDHGNGKLGLGDLWSLGFTPSTLSPYTVHTPSGGRHIYLRHKDGLTNSASHLPKAIDVRADGGYVLAPGAWSNAGLYYANWDLTEAIYRGLPRWKPELLPPSKADAPKRTPGLEPFGRVRDALSAVPADCSYEEWNSCLMALHHETGGSDIGLELAQDWSSDDPRWDEMEVDAKWKSYGRSDIACIGIGSLYRIAKGYGWSAITAEDFEDIEDEGEPETASRLRFLSPSDCALSDPRPYVMKGLIAQRDIGCIVGAPGVGKSLLAPSIAYSIALGESVFGRRVKQGPVFYVAAEDAHGMRGRVTALKNERGEAEDFTLVEGVADLLSETVHGCGSQDFRELCDAVRDQRPSLVVIDTLAMAFPGLEENSAEGMGRVVAIARDLTEWGAAVILVHHDTKEGGGLPRGHSLLNGALDFSIQLKKSDGVVSGKLTKIRNGSCDACFAFTIAAHVIGTDEDGDTITAAIAQTLEAPPAPSVSMRAALVLSVLERMCDDETTITETDWRTEALGEPDLCDSDKTDSRRAAFRRARDELVGAGIVTKTDAGYRLRQVSAADFDDVDLDD